jgi:hypothetical protein
MTTIAQPLARYAAWRRAGDLVLLSTPRPGASCAATTTSRPRHGS